jgi:hypothetical protein
MTTTMTIVIVVVIAVALIAVLASRGGGPRVTTIERRTHRDIEEGEQ